MPRDREQLLEELKRSKYNRRLSEIHAVLIAFGWVLKRAKGGHELWQHGSRTVTLVKPHGREPAVLPVYVSRVCSLIEQSRDEETDYGR